MSEKTLNPYFELKKADFLSAAAKKLEIRKDFNPERIDEYASINTEYASSAAELIKLGIDSFLDEETVVIIVDGDNYEIPSKDVCNALGERQFDYIFGKKKSNDASTHDDDYYYDKVDAESYTEPSMDFRDNTANHNMMMNPMIMNPFITMMNYLMYPFQYAYGAMQNPIFMQQAPVENKAQESKNSGDELSDILKNISEIQKQVLNLEKEKVGSKEHASSLRTRYETAKKDLKDAEDRSIAEREQHSAEMQDLQRIMAEMDEKYEFLEKEKIALEEDKQTLQNDYEKIRLENEQKNTTIKKLEEEKDYIEARLTGISKQAEQSAADKQNAENKVSALQEEKNKAASELDKVRNELKNQKSDNEENAERYRNIKAERDDLKREVKNLRQELEKVKNNNASLKDKNTSLFSEVSALKEDSQKLQQDSQKFQDLAYIDKKTGLFNLNAFNRDFTSTEKNIMVAAQIHICGMKEINDTYGRQHGDEVIKEVGRIVKEFFPDAKIYRIYGDQFFIIVENGNMNSVKGQLFDIKNKLAQDQISIAYGAAAGFESTNHKDIIDKINDEVREMKQIVYVPQENFAGMVTPQEEAPVQEAELEEELLDETLYAYMN